MTDTLLTFLDPYMLIIIPVVGFNRPNMDAEMTYLKKNKIDEAIHNKLSKKDVYGTDMHNIYNIILCQTNKQLQDKA